MNVLETIMHTRFPFVPALILVLAPLALSLLLAVLYHVYSERKSSKQREDSPATITSASHRRDDLQAILLFFGIATLAFAVSARAQSTATQGPQHKILAPKILSSPCDRGNLSNPNKIELKPCGKIAAC
jgi:uncharacterized membrane protein